MKLNVGLLLDLGNSETRVKVLTGKKAFLFKMSNQFMPLPSDYFVNEKYSKGGTTIFFHKGFCIANGAIVDVEFNSQSMKPNGISSKTEQMVTEYSVNLALYKALTILAKEYRVPLTSLDVTFKISLLLPPIEHEVREDELIDKVKQITKVHTITPIDLAFEKEFTIASVDIYPEAVASFFGASFDEVGNVHSPVAPPVFDKENNHLILDNGNHLGLNEVENNKKFAEGLVLVLDIGAGTTDLATFKNMELIESSKNTFNRGGLAVESWVKLAIKKKYMFVPQDMSEVVNTGLLRDGGVVHDVSDIVTQAKNRYAAETTQEINDYLVSQSFSPRMLRGLLVSGGGALESVRVDESGTPRVVSPAMGNVMMDHIRSLAPNIELMTTLGKDLRLLNIDGLTILHKYSS